MIENIKINDYIQDDKVDKIIDRVKIFYINKRNQVYLIHNNNTVQLPGGHVEENENLIDAVKREIYEELGIKLDNLPTEFLEINAYYENYFNTNKTVKANIHYFYIKSNIKPNLNNIKLDNLEKKTPFKLFTVSKDNLNSFINLCIKENKIDENIGNEMEVAIKYFLKKV